jgi:hypothetical protein
MKVIEKEKVKVCRGPLAPTCTVATFKTMTINTAIF